jgi:hypothetical protein
MPVTKNIATRANILVIVANTTHTHTSSTAFKIADFTLSFSFLSLICLAIFSITTVELSTSIHRAKTKAKRTILFILSHTIKAIRNTANKVKGIAKALLIASFFHKYTSRTKNTIIILSIRFIIKSFVAFLATCHKSETFIIL